MDVLAAQAGCLPELAEIDTFALRVPESDLKALLLLFERPERPSKP
jgi:hypothetical protein